VVWTGPETELVSSRCSDWLLIILILLIFIPVIIIIVKNMQCSCIVHRKIKLTSISCAPWARRCLCLCSQYQNIRCVDAYEVYVILLLLSAAVCCCFGCNLLGYRYFDFYAHYSLFSIRLLLAIVVVLLVIIIHYCWLLIS